MLYKLNHILKRPISNEVYDLFEFCVNILIQKMNGRYPIDLNSDQNGIKNHIQWTNFIFGSGNEENMKKLSRVTKEFNKYIIHYNSNKFKWNFELIFNEHPNFFHCKNEKKFNRNSIEEMIDALDDEITASKKDSRKNKIKIDKIEKHSFEDTEFVYKAFLVIDIDDEPNLFEDLPIIIRIGGMNINSNVLEYDKLENILYFKQVNKVLHTYNGKKELIVDPSWILEEIKKRLSNYQLTLNPINPISKFLKGTIVPEKITSNIHFNNLNNLDKSQILAVESSINNDITLIWGPPGTGKSHTLASLIKTFYENNEKTLIVSTANVAVDAIAEKLVNLLNQLNIKVFEGQILRIGHTRSDFLLKTDFLFPENIDIKNLRFRILAINKKIEKTEDIEIKIKLKSQNQILKSKLKKIVENLIKNSIINFATASKFFIDENLYGQEYDNLIIDEASMVSIPHFVALSKNIKKRIIITGDFRQLGPVVLSQSHLSIKWLHKDIFEYSGIEPKNKIINHIAIQQLLTQRRSTETICNIINEPFYNNKLISNQFLPNNKLLNNSLFGGKSIHYYPLTENINEVKFTKAQSRKNYVSLEKTIEILEKISVLPQNDISVGIITPYRGQVQLLKNNLKKGNIDKAFIKRIKIGTIHSFQGSECDIVIFDTVEASNYRIGKLYQFLSGRRLVNVAISRAKHVLIVVGDLEVFLSGSGYNSIDNSVYKIFKKLSFFEIKENNLSNYN